MGDRAIRTALSICGLTALTAFACGSEDEQAGSGGKAGAGAAASGGSAGKAGSSGASASGGAGGSAGRGGAAGSAGAGGASAGTGGSSAGAAGSGAGAGGGSSSDSGSCFRAKRLWFEDWETGDYSRWTSRDYGNAWGNDCQSNGFSTVRASSPTHSNRSQISCSYTAEGNVHRGYGGLQFSGDSVVPAYTNQGQGIDAPNGLVNIFHVYFETNTTFQNGTWFSFWTVNGSCDWTEDVLTLGLEDPSNRLAAAHYQVGGGTRSFAPGAVGLPRGQWVRITIYVNYHDETMHVWQNGQKISDVVFRRASTRICQWHWGAYASGDNTNVVLFEDDNSIWKLEEPWTDRAREPYFGADVPVCP